VLALVDRVVVVRVVELEVVDLLAGLPLVVVMTVEVVLVIIIGILVDTVVAAAAIDINDTSKTFTNTFIIHQL